MCCGCLGMTKYSEGQNLMANIRELIPIKVKVGSGCGSVGRAVTWKSRGPWFKCSIGKINIEHLLSAVLKDENNEKGPFKKLLW